ncbi:MAG: hypothetical protein RJA97_145, partial [Bacteroidota bacterium]
GSLAEIGSLAGIGSMNADVAKPQIRI